MSRKYAAMLLALGAVWGASYLFNEIGLRGFGPGSLIEARFLFATATLAVVVHVALGWRGAIAGYRAAWRRLAIVALLNAVVPFFLIAWGQQYVDSGLTGILLASSPLFTAVAALVYDRSERATGIRLAGLLLGLAGVVLLLGANPAGGGEALAGAIAIVGAALSYSLSGLYIGRELGDVPRLVVASGVTAFAAVLSLPLALLEPPTEFRWDSLLAAVALGVGGTGLAYVLYFAIIGGAGASRAILVNYLIPLMAVAYGVVLLDEELTASMVAGLALILGGVTLGAGVVRMRSVRS